MTLGFVVMLFGVFGVPIALLWASHHFRRRSPRIRAAFWGGLTGHLIALVVGSVAAMMPAAEWSAADTWRGLLGFWSWAVLPAVGAVVGLVLAREGRR